MASTLFPTNPLSTLLEATCYGSKESRAVMETEAKLAPCTTSTRPQAGAKIQIGKVRGSNARYECNDCELSHVTFGRIQSEDAVYELSGHSGEEFNHIPVAANRFFNPPREEPAPVFVAPERVSEKKEIVEIVEIVEEEVIETETEVEEAAVAVIAPRFSEENFVFAEY